MVFLGVMFATAGIPFPTPPRVWTEPRDNSLLLTYCLQSLRHQHRGLFVITGFAGKKGGRRADSNRLPLLQLRVCRRTFQTILVHPVIWLICGVFGVSEVIWRPLRTGVCRPGCTMVALCSVELYSSYVPARNLRHARRPNLALRVTCVE